MGGSVSGGIGGPGGGASSGLSSGPLGDQDGGKYQDCETLEMLMTVFSTNVTNWKEQMEAKGCSQPSNTSQSALGVHYDNTNRSDQAQLPDFANHFYAYLTPFIIFVGLCGNMISLRVFMTRGLRKLSASLYLAAISVSDSLVLLIYVLLRWLNEGLPVWPGGYRLPIINTNGICHAFLYFSYLFRFLSVWLIVIFTIERYIAACRPLQRRIICTKSFGRKAILFVALTGCIMSVYKPIVSGVFESSELMKLSNGASTHSPHDDLLQGLLVGPSQSGMCTRNPKYTQVNFVMDVMYGLSTTAVPFIVISVFNMLIVRTLIRRDATIKKLKIMFKDSRIRWEFTIMLLVVSSCFVCLNLPYFVFWCQTFLHNIEPSEVTASEDLSNVTKYSSQLLVTRTIYTLNYSINFFLYCLTGAYYRGALVAVFTNGKRNDRASFRTASTTSCTRETKL